MSSSRLDQYCRDMAIRLNPQYSVSDILKEAADIRAYLNTNSSTNLGSLHLMYKDLLAFSETLSLDGGPLQLRDYQADLLKAWGTGEESLVIHARGMGMTLLLAVYAVWLVSFHEDATVAIVSASDAENRTIREIVSRLHRFCDYPLPKIKQQNRTNLTFDNENSIHFITFGTYVLGKSISHLLVDNAGQISFSNDENIYSLFLMTSDQVVMVGTPNRSAGIFHDLASSHTWFPKGKKYLPFTEYDAYDEVWEAQMRKELNYSDFESEYNCYFKPAYLY